MTIPHLDEEALSAALDGEGSPEEMEHLAACRQCQAGVARLAVVARAVGAPVAGRSAADVAAAVGRALAADDGAAGVAAGQPPRVLRAPSEPPARGSGRKPPHWVTAAAGLAAAVLVVAAIAGIMRQSGGPTGNTTSAVAPLSGSASTTVPGSPPSTTPDDLGDQSDPVALARTVRGRLNMADAKTAQAAPISPASGATPSPTFAGPPCGAQGPVAAGIAGGGGSIQAPTLVASLRWRGEPAVLLVYRGPAGSVGVVMRTADCVRLAQIPL